MENLTADLAEQIDRLAACVSEYIERQQASDSYSSQKLYEKWIKLDEWLLRDQALPLTVGVSPEGWPGINDAKFKQQEAATWAEMSARIASESNDLILNPKDMPAAWLVNSTEYYQWLNQQGVVVPDALDGLMQFIMSVVARPVQNRTAQTFTKNLQDSIQLEQTGIAGPTVKEKVLAAALNIVVKEPAHCRDPSGLMNSRALAEMINAQSVRWFETAQAPMSVEAMEALLGKCLE